MISRTRASCQADLASNSDDESGFTCSTLQPSSVDKQVSNRFCCSAYRFRARVQARLSSAIRARAALISTFESSLRFKACFRNFSKPFSYAAKALGSASFVSNSLNSTVAPISTFPLFDKSEKTSVSERRKNAEKSVSLSRVPATATFELAIIENSGTRDESRREIVARSLGLCRDVEGTLANATFTFAIAKAKSLAACSGNYFIASANTERAVSVRASSSPSTQSFG